MCTCGHVTQHMHRPLLRAPLFFSRPMLMEAQHTSLEALSHSAAANVLYPTNTFHCYRVWLAYCYHCAYHCLHNTGDAGGYSCDCGSIWCCEVSLEHAKLLQLMASSDGRYGPPNLSTSILEALCVQVDILCPVNNCFL